MYSNLYDVYNLNRVQYKLYVVTTMAAVGMVKQTLSIQNHEINKKFYPRKYCAIRYAW